MSGKGRLGIKYVCLFLGIAVLYLLLAMQKGTYQDWSSYASADITFANGETEHVDSNEFQLLGTGDRLVLHIQLPEEQKIDAAVLRFYVYHAVVEARYQDQILWQSGADIAQKGDMIGLIMPAISIPDEAWGHSIDISFQVYEKNAFSKVNTLWMYPKDQAYRYYLERNPVAFYISVVIFSFVLFISMLMFLTGTDTMGKLRTGCLAWLALLIAVWVFSRYGVYGLFGYQYAWVWLEYISLFSLGIPLVLYMFTLESEKSNRIVQQAALMVVGVFVVVTTILNFTNIIHYCDFVFLDHVLMGGLCLVLLYSVLKSFRKSDPSSRYFLIGFLVFVGTTVFDLCSYNLSKYIPGLYDINLPAMVPYGMLVLLICLLKPYRIGSEQEFQNSKRYEKDYNNLESAVLHGIAKYRNDENLTLVFANDIFFQMHGFQNEEEANKAGYVGVMDYVDLDRRDEVRANAKEIIEKNLNHLNVEYPIMRRDGKQLWALCCIGYSRKENMFNASILDITERKRTERQLRVAQAEFQTALGLSDCQILSYSISKDTITRRFETHNLLKIRPRIHAPVNYFIRGSYVSEDTQEDLKLFFASMQQGKPVGEMNLCYRTDVDSPYRWYFAKFTMIYEDKQPVNAVISIQDITEQIEAEMAQSMHRQMILAMPQDKNSYYEFNLTKDICEFISGTVAKSVVDRSELDWDHMVQTITQLYVQKEDKNKVLKFLYSANLIQAYQQGRTELELNYRAYDFQKTEIWCKITVTLAADRRTGDVKVFCLFSELDDAQTQIIQLQRNMDSLEQELENGRVKTLVSQMQPHFLYNALSAIRSIVKVNPDYAYDLLYDFTVHLRSSVKSLSSDDLIPFSEELANIRAYLNIESMRQGERLHISYEIEDEDFMVAPLTIQPLAENAARHGIFPKGKLGGTIIIRTYLNEQGHILEIIDDGVGFDTKDIVDRKENSYGLRNLMYRLNILMHATIVFDSERNKGTKVTITVPLKEG